MEEEYLSADSLDGLDDFALTGDYDDLPEQQETSQETEKNSQEEPSSSEHEESEQQVDENAQDDLTDEILKLKGIGDSSKIKFEDEKGNIVERSWDSLTKSEKLNILASEGNPETDLDEDEIIFINTLRANNLTPQQYIQDLQRQISRQVSEQLQQTQTPIYEVDSMSDDELFILDLLDKVGDENITDEELQEALEQAKANETLYAKQVEGLRTVYKNLEDQQRYNAEQAQAEQLENQYQDFSNQVLNSISSFTNLANQEIELSVDDKNDLANFLLTRRESGVSDFYTAIQNPNTATLAAFWLLKGPEILEEFDNQVKLAYKRGLNMGSFNKTITTPVTTPKEPTVVVQTPETNKSTIDLQSAFSLGDESYLQ